MTVVSTIWFKPMNKLWGSLQKRLFGGKYQLRITIDLSVGRVVSVGKEAQYIERILPVLLSIIALSMRKPSESSNSAMKNHLLSSNLPIPTSLPIPLKYCSSACLASFTVLICLLAP